MLCRRLLTNLSSSCSSFSRSFPSRTRLLNPDTSSSCLTSSPKLVVAIFTIGNTNQTQRAAMPPPPIVVDATGEHKYTLIFMHGLGDTGHGWSESFHEIQPPNWKMIFPHAPTQKVTLNAGVSMPSWFDILTLSESGSEDEAGIHKASEDVRKWVDDEISSTGLSSERIFLGGFSQGGALAMYTALKYPSKLGGCLAMSSWLPLRNEFPEALSQQNKNLRIFHGHGTSDFVVPFRWGEASRLFLQNIGVTNYTFKAYAGMAHSSCNEEMSDIADFFSSVGK